MSASQKPSFLDRLKAFFTNPFKRKSAGSSASGGSRKGGTYNSSKNRSSRKASGGGSGGMGARSFSRPDGAEPKRSDRAKAKSRKVKPKG